MTRRAQLVVVRLLSLASAAFALLPRPASAWWETQIVTNKWEYDGVEYLGATGTQWLNTGVPATGNITLGIDADWKLSSRSDCELYSDGAQRNLRLNGERGTPASLYYNYVTSGGFYYALNGRSLFEVRVDGISINGTKAVSYSGSYLTSGRDIYIFYGNHLSPAIGNIYCVSVLVDGEYARYLLPVLHEGEGKMLDLVSGTLYANAGTGAFSYGAVTGTVNCVIVSTNRVYHANLPASAYDELSPWNAPERTRIGGDDRTLRPSAQIKQY